MNPMRSAFLTLGLLCFVHGGAFAQSASADMAVTACASDTDCAGRPDTPHCCLGPSCTPANVCVQCVDFAGNPCAPVACDGGLCDTTNSSTCTVGPGLGKRGGGNATLWIVGLGALALAAALRGRRRAAERGR
jgi:hypothetical protein